MIVCQTMERIYRLGPALIEKRNAGRCRDRQARAAYGNVGDMVSNQAVGAADAPEDFSLGAEQHQAIRRGDDLNVSLRIRNNPVDAKHLIVLNVNGLLHAVEISNIDTAIEVANPKLARAVQRQR